MPRSAEAQAEIQNMSTIYGAPVEVSNGRPTFVEAKGVRAIKLQQKAIKLQERMLKFGIRSATIINLRPFEIRPQGQHASNYPVAACKPGQKYTKTVIPCHEITVINNEHGDEDVEEVLAIDIASDIKGQMNKSGYNGVVVFMGERDPLAPPDPRDPEMRDIRKEMADEEQKMIREFHEVVQRAEDAHANGKGRQLINDMARGCAHYLLQKKLLKKQPAWILESRTEAEVATPCIACGAEPLTKEALQCKACTTWLRPYEAAKAGLLSPAVDGGTLALQRCTKEQLIELGFYPHVRPTAEANAEWLKQTRAEPKK